MRAFLILALAASFTLPVVAQAATKPYYQDIKLPTQKMVERQAFTNLLAAASTRVLNASAGPTSAAAATVTSFAAQPDSPRNLTLTASAPDYNKLNACDVTVTGKDINDNALTETLSLDAGQSTQEVGTKAFKSVTSVAWAASCEASPYNVNYYLGIGEKIGVKRCLDAKGHIFHSTLNGDKEGTAPTMTVDASTVSLNTADFNGTMDGTSDFELFFMQNFRCLR